MVPQNPIFDALYCEEERFDDDGGESKIEDLGEIQKPPFAILPDHDFFWEEEELKNLLLKEKNESSLIYNELDFDSSLKSARSEAISWMLKVIRRYAFNAATAALAVNYYDRFVTSCCFQKEKPWMSQLAAVACLSVAAKVEETQVPLLLDLQVEESKYLFEAKTIQRMELLLLSTLQWRMNPVTPMSFFDHIARRFEFVRNLHWEFLRRCEGVILSAIADSRLVHYLPSVIAAATMIYAIREIGDEDVVEYEDQLMLVLKASKEEIDDCLTLILEATGGLSRKSCCKRKFDSIPSSPSGVIDAYFSSDSSVDSWAVALSASSSPEPLFKRSRALAPLSSMSVGPG
ncbi:cyclin-D3-3 [Salvia miltiorrhiza]|uniref:cyclin-D3-3 n=1 Tax=Salvia miltiorrhiza TaxID=226208 RepID=UPI0025AD27F6|nr:cyclin-D3-3 [Salvia miltiorrhiza]